MGPAFKFEFAQENLALIGRPDLGVTFTKLACWRLTQYEKAVFVDADTLVSHLSLQSVTLLGNGYAEGGKMCSFELVNELPYSPQVLANADELFGHDEIAAVADIGWPDFFNSGVFVFRPSADTYRTFCALVLAFRVWLDG